MGTPLVVLIGIPGNILSFLVMKSRRYRHKSYSHYLCTLAIFDSLVLIGRYLQRVDHMMLGTVNRSLYDGYGDAACKIHNFAEHVCYLMSSWLVLCMTMERFIAVNFPFKKETYCRPRSAVTVILVVFAIMSYSQIFRLIVIEKFKGQCTAPEKYLHIYTVMHIYLYQVGFQFLIPALLILFFNMSILYKIRKLRNEVTRHGHTHQGHNNYNRAHSKRHKTTLMLLVVSFTYLVTLLPLVLISLILHIAFSLDKATAVYLFVKLSDLGRLFELFSEVNYGINFYIYVMSGAQFRYELRYMCSRPYSFISSPAYTEKVFQFRKTSST